MTDLSDSDVPSANEVPTTPITPYDTLNFDVIDEPDKDLIQQQLETPGSIATVGDTTFLANAITEPGVTPTWGASKTSTDTAGVTKVVQDTSTISPIEGASQ